MVMDADVPEEESTAPGRPGAHVDRVLHDGDTVELGGSKLTARLTPGHTKGCTTWTMQVQDGGRTLDAVIVGSPNVNPGYVLVGDKKNYPADCRRLREDLCPAQEPAGRFVSWRARRLLRFEEQAAEDDRRRGQSLRRSLRQYKAYVAEREQAFEKELAKETADAHLGDGVGFDIAWITWR